MTWGDFGVTLMFVAVLFLGVMMIKGRDRRFDDLYVEDEKPGQDPEQER